MNFFFSCSNTDSKSSNYLPPSGAMVNNFVTITGSLTNDKLSGPMVAYVDPLDFKMKPLSYVKYELVNNNFKIMFHCEKPSNIQLFLKDVWVQPGDSIHVDHRVISENPFRDTLLFSGSRLGGSHLPIHHTPTSS